MIFKELVMIQVSGRKPNIAQSRQYLVKKWSEEIR
jgi:hypothetical protein